MNKQILSDIQIQTLYSKFIQPLNLDNFKNKYIPLPIHKNNKNWKWEGKDFPRVISLLEFEDMIKKYEFSFDKILTFNGGDDPELEYLQGHYKQILNIDYDKKSEHSLYTLQLKHNNFDFVMLNQTLEHLYDPFLCLENIKKYINPGGYLYLNAPACNAPHSDPFHFYIGFTLMGLLCICESLGYKILEAGQWGNEEYLMKLWSRKPGWSDYQQLSNPGKNELQNPVIVWCLVQVPDVDFPGN